MTDPTIKRLWHRSGSSVAAKRLDGISRGRWGEWELGTQGMSSAGAQIRVPFGGKQYVVFAAA